MAHRQYPAMILASLCLAASAAFAQPAVTIDDIDQADGQATYTHQLLAADMAGLDRLEDEAAEVEGVALHEHRNVHFVSAEEGLRTAHLTYRFDFSDVPYMPKSVAWRDRLTIFPHKSNPSLRIVSEWSVDGEQYQTIQRAESKPDEWVNLGDLSGGEPIDLPDDTRVVYYRVRFEAVGEGSEFVGNTVQWNRTGKNAPLFRAAFELKPVTDQAVDGSLSAAVSYPAEAPHLAGGMAYPRSVTTMDTAEGWRFLGATRGHRGGIEVVEAPRRPGELALRCEATVNHANPDAPRWLTWERPLSPPLNVVDTEEVVFDLYPIDDPIDFQLMVQLGRQRGFGIIPAGWGLVGELEPGRWHTVRIPVKNKRPDIDAFRLTFNSKRHDVPQDRPIRFVIDRLRFEPAPDQPTNTFTDVLRGTGPVAFGYLQQTSPKEISEGDAVAFDVELQCTERVDAELIVEAENDRTGRSRSWAVPVALRPPFTAVEVQVNEAMGVLGPGTHRYRVGLESSGGVQLVSGEGPAVIAAFSRLAMDRQRHALLEKTEALLARADELAAAGKLTAEPRITLVTARWFLEDGGHVESDFNEQQQRSIAMQELADLEDLVRRAESQLQDRASGRVTERAVEEYQPGEPLTIAEGKLMQRGRPILLIGPMAGVTDMARFGELGFNSSSVQTRIEDWYHGEGRTGRSFLEDYFQRSRDHGLSTNVLLASHYPPDPMPARFEGAESPHTGVGMMPWDVLVPQTERLFEDWYGRVMPLLASQSTLASVGTANEPGYTVDRESQSFAEAFGPWAQRQYGDIEAANARWGTGYADFEAIELGSFFDRREVSPAAEYDWQRFVDDQVAPFFERRKQQLESGVPGMPVWVKLMGHDRDFGFRQLNEHSITARGQTVLGTDGRDPMWLDYMKSIDPSLPVFNTEWHILRRAEPNNQAMLTQRLYDGVVHGIQTGLLWIWTRKPWDTRVLGGDQSLTRWPRTLDAVGRTSLRMRALIEPLSSLANTDGGRVRMLYSIAESTRDREAYMEGLRGTYETMGRNATGTRFVFAHRLTPADLRGVALLAASATRSMEAAAAEAIERWVAEGGTLWREADTPWIDPWGRPLTGLPAAFVEAVATPGTHVYGEGAIVVGESPDLARFCDGPWAEDAAGNHLASIDVRRLDDADGGWLSLVNRSDSEVTFELVDAEGRWEGAGPMQDVWNRQPVDASEAWRLPAYGVALIRYEAR